MSVDGEVVTTCGLIMDWKIGLCVYIMLMGLTNGLIFCFTYHRAY